MEASAAQTEKDEPEKKVESPSYPQISQKDISAIYIHHIHMHHTHVRIIHTYQKQINIHIHCIHTKP